MLTTVVRNLDKLKFLADENSTTILTSVGVTGTIATAYLSARASFKAARIIDVEEEIINRGVTVEPVYLTQKGKVKLVWKCYIPAVGMGATTVICIIAAHRIHSGKIAALAVASATSQQALQEYKNKVFDKLGEVKERNVRDEVAQDRVDKQPVRAGEVIITGKGEVLFYDQHSGRYFHSTVEDVKRAENRINHELLNQMGCSLSEFYDEIGLPPSNYSDSVGWNGGERIDVEFSTTLSSDQRPCVAIDFRRPPAIDYIRHTYG